MKMTPAQSDRQRHRGRDGRYTSTVRAEAAVGLEPTMGHNGDDDLYGGQCSPDQVRGLADHGSALKDRLAVAVSAHIGASDLSSTDPDPVVRACALDKSDLSEEDRTRLSLDPEVGRILARISA